MTICTENCSPGVETSLNSLSGDVLQRLRHWAHLSQIKAVVRRERALLLSLDDRQLKDIGITREQAIEEARREDVPASRLNQR